MKESKSTTIAETPRTLRGTARPRVSLKCPEPSLAVQASKDECDINNIVKKYLRTGEPPEQRQGVYADLSQFTSLQDALHIANEGMQLFMELPADVRRYFDNDPTKLVAFAADPANTEKAIELGLATRRVKDDPPSQPAPASGAGSPPEKRPEGAAPNTT